MNSITFILIITTLFSNKMVNDNSTVNIYVKALTLSISELLSVNSDTIIVQKEDFLPDNLPEVINKHSIKYLSEKEIEDYDGNKVTLKKIFPIQVENELVIIRISDFGYSPKSKLWISVRGSFFKFKYDCKEQQFTFFEKTDYGI